MAEERNKTFRNKLNGFHKIILKLEETKRVKIAITSAEMAFNRKGSKAVGEPREFRLEVGNLVG